MNLGQYQFFGYVVRPQNSQVTNHGDRAFARQTDPPPIVSAFAVTNGRSEIQSINKRFRCLS
jgi:hypothetical protein